MPLESAANRVTGEESVVPSVVVNWPCRIREAIVSVFGKRGSLLAIKVIVGTNVKGSQFSKLEKEAIVVDSRLMNWEVIVRDSIVLYVSSVSGGMTDRSKSRVTRC